MIIVAVLALTGILISLRLINKANSKEAHMQASAIFTSNDIILNGGVILAGLLVFFGKQMARSGHWWYCVYLCNAWSAENFEVI